MRVTAYTQNVCATVLPHPPIKHIREKEVSHGQNEILSTDSTV